MTRHTLHDPSTLECSEDTWEGEAPDQEQHGQHKPGELTSCTAMQVLCAFKTCSSGIMRA